ncbi:LuxR C-terminal-related transcriptional regulator [Pseudoalteromonas sp. C2R02]|nr:LuxR C-terminal-related transcriptional regulator [Pseudoalteromonas sp. C2R02]
MSNKEVASSLNNSERIINVYLFNIMQKLDLTNVVE